MHDRQEEAQWGASGAGHPSWTLRGIGRYGGQAPPAIREGEARVRSEGVRGGRPAPSPERIRDGILRLRARGLGSQAIADQANAWPVPTARGAVVGQHGPRSLSAGPTPNRRQTSGPTFSRTRWNEMQGRGSGIVVAWFGEYHRAMRQVWILAAAHDNGGRDHRRGSPQVNTESFDAPRSVRMAEQ